MDILCSFSLQRNLYLPMMSPSSHPTRRSTWRPRPGRREQPSHYWLVFASPLCSVVICYLFFWQSDIKLQIPGMAFALCWVIIRMYLGYIWSVSVIYWGVLRAGNKQQQLSYANLEKAQAQWARNMCALVSLLRISNSNPGNSWHLVTSSPVTVDQLTAMCIL